MKAGIVFFSFVKMFQGQPKIRTEPKSFVFYSSNNELANKLALILAKKSRISRFENRKNGNFVFC